jgi:hypothetical protein
VFWWSQFLATYLEVRIRFPTLPDCGLVVRVLGYRSGGLGSIPGTTRFSGGKNPDFLRNGGSGTESTQPREYN